jgi:hypothetical protein
MRRVKRKMTKAEKLNRQIESWERKQEDAVIMLRRSAEELLKLRRQRLRMLKRETARAVVWPSGEPVKSGDIDSGSTVEIEVETGTVKAIEPPEGQRFGPDEAIKSPLDVRPPKADEDIPTFLDRTKGNDADAVARAEIEAEQAAKKKAKAERAAEKRKIKQETVAAELTGQRRKMPLTGKQALAAIRAK